MQIPPQGSRWIRGCDGAEFTVVSSGKYGCEDNPIVASSLPGDLEAEIPSGESWLGEVEEFYSEFSPQQEAGA